jgi:hypothetical protein
MTFRQLVLDAILSCEQPIHCFIELVNIDITKSQFISKRVTGSPLVDASRTTEFRTGRQYPIGNHSQHEVTFTTRA